MGVRWVAEARLCLCAFVLSLRQTVHGRPGARDDGTVREQCKQFALQPKTTTTTTTTKDGAAEGQWRLTH
uniref:Putative secreted peptide n=1 Tax=Anopheles braziliensis TaxID=58242 RepID=A0A2M3ZMU7_9DIPT